MENKSQQTKTAEKNSASPGRGQPIDQILCVSKTRTGSEYFRSWFYDYTGDSFRGNSIIRFAGQMKIAAPDIDMKNRHVRIKEKQAVRFINAEKAGGDVFDKQIKDDLITGLRAILGNSLQQIILYGSVARHEETEESDIDVAIVLEHKFTEEQWKSVLPFYKNVCEEGIVLWKAA